MMLALLRHLADSTLFAMIIGLLYFCMRRRGPAARHTLLLIAVAKFAVPTVAFSWLGQVLGGLLPTSRLAASVPVEISDWVITTATSVPAKTASVNWLDLLIIAWGVGSAVAFGLWARTAWSFHAIEKRRDDSDAAWFVGLKEKIGLKSDVQLAMSEAVREPALAGFTRPVVLIPSALADQLSPAELQSVVLHELAHAKRRDNWTSVFAHTVSCVFWFYPLLWWIEKRLRAERELACDEMVVRCGAAPDDYFAGILKVCRFHLVRELAGVAGISGSNLKGRKEVIMSISPNIPFRRLPKTLIAGLIAAVVGVPLMIGLMSASNTRADADPANAVKGTMFDMAEQAGAPAQIIEATFGVKSLLLRAKLKNVGSRSITQYRIGWIVVYRDGKTAIASGQTMNVPAQIAPGAVEDVPNQGVSGKFLNNDPQKIMFFLDDARFSNGESWTADTHAIATEATRIEGVPGGTKQSTPRSVAEGPFTCVFESVDYPEGTVIQEGSGPEQMCVRQAGSSGLMMWVRTSQAARERSTKVVHVPTPPPVFCTPKASTEAGLCACENTGPFSSGARVNSAKSAYQLRCDNGDWVQTFTPNVKRP